MENTAFPDGWKVTASFGVTELLAEDDMDVFVERAGMAMFFAKAHGKNRVYSVASDAQAELTSTSYA